MKKKYFIKCINAVMEHVIKELKEEIKNQLDLISDDGLENVEEPLYYLEKSMTLLDCDLLFLCWINDGVDAHKEMKDGMYTTLYEEDSYYGFDVVDIIKKSGIDADADEFNKILISYLKGECSFDDMDND